MGVLRRWFGGLGGGQVGFAEWCVVGVLGRGIVSGHGGFDLGAWGLFGAW